MASSGIERISIGDPLAHLIASGYFSDQCDESWYGFSSCDEWIEEPLSFWHEGDGPLTNTYVRELDLLSDEDRYFRPELRFDHQALTLNEIHLNGVRNEMEEARKKFEARRLAEKAAGKCSDPDPKPGYNYSDKTEIPFGPAALAHVPELQSRKRVSDYFVKDPADYPWLRTLLRYVHLVHDFLPDFFPGVVPPHELAVSDPHAGSAPPLDLYVLFSSVWGSRLPPILVRRLDMGLRDAGVISKEIFDYGPGCIPNDVCGCPLEIFNLTAYPHTKWFCCRSEVEPRYPQVYLGWSQDNPVHWSKGRKYHLRSGPDNVYVICSKLLLDGERRRYDAQLLMCGFLRRVAPRVRSAGFIYVCVRSYNEQRLSDEGTFAGIGKRVSICAVPVPAPIVE
jgi:hypothetical protein